MHVTTNITHMTPGTPMKATCEYCGATFNGAACGWLCPHCGWKNHCCGG